MEKTQLQKSHATVPLSRYNKIECFNRQRVLEIKKTIQAKFAVGWEAGKNNGKTPRCRHWCQLASFLKPATLLKATILQITDDR